jgi:chaperonin GroEL
MAVEGKKSAFSTQPLFFGSLDTSDYLHGMNQGYTPKDLEFGEAAKLRLIEGISKMSQAVGSTLGPAGRTVLVESPQHTHGITVTKDGVTVAKAMQLLDPVENLAVSMMREASARTATAAGDGTTTAIVIAEALVKAGMKYIEGDWTVVLNRMVELTKEVVEHLKSGSREVTDDNLLSIATISANNDEGIGKLISDAYIEVGRDGVVMAALSQDSETYSEVTHGMRVDRGYSSEMFITDQSTDECRMEDVHILVSDAEISNLMSMELLLGDIIAKKKRLLIIAPCTRNVTNTLAANKMKDVLKVCVVPPPSFGYRQHELMSDIAEAVGATYFSEKTGDDLSIIRMEDLGHVKSITVSKDMTVLVHDDIRVDTTHRVDELKAAAKKAKKKGDKEFITSRIASLSGAVGVIHVGGNTDLEQKELFDRVDDAICAVRSALEEGIVAGGGVALENAANIVLSKDTSPAHTVMFEGLLAPIERILSNADMEYTDVYAGIDEEERGYDVKSGEYGNMFDMGIIDPLKVTRHALQNAVSVAVTILSTDAILTMARA